VKVEMNKNEAKKKIQKLREEINLHNYKYYVENSPVISDYEFDQLLKKLETLESEFPDLITSDSPTQRDDQLFRFLSHIAHHMMTTHSEVH